MTEKKETKERKLTKYAVFFVKPSDEWVPVGTVDAAGGKAAVQLLAKTPGAFRAVPVSNITDQAMGYPPPPEPVLVPVDQLTLTEPAALHEAIAPPADPPDSAAGGSLRAVEDDDGA